MINFNLNLKTINGESLIGTSDIIIPVVTLTSQLTNDSNFITSSALTGFATEVWVEAKNYLTSASLNGYATEAWVNAQNFLTNVDLNGYATTSYVDGLINALVIPTKTSDLTNDSGFITATSLTNFYTKTETDTKISDAINALSIPTKTSDLTNDSGFITVNDLPPFNEDFTDLNDTPNSYSGQAGKLVAVNDTNDGLVFITPAASGQIQSDWTQTNPLEVDYIKNKPTIPDVSDYYTKSEVDTLIEDVEDLIPTKTSDLLNDSDFITSDYVDDEINDLAMVAKTGDYDDLIGKPTIPAEQVNSDWNATTGKAEILNKPVIPSIAGLATEQYVDDAIDGLNIPTKTSDLTNDSGFITSTALNDYYTKSEVDMIEDNLELQIMTVNEDLTDLDDSLATVAKTGSYNDLGDKPTIPASQVNSDWNATSGVSQILNKPVIPTNTNQLTNGSGYITNSVNDLTNYYDKSTIDTQLTSINESLQDLKGEVDLLTINANITLTEATHFGKFILVNGTRTITIATDATQPGFSLGTRIDGFSLTNDTTFAIASGVTVISNEDKLVVTAKTGWSLIKVATNTWTIVGLLK